jgi:hypothetical protein
MYINIDEKMKPNIPHISNNKLSASTLTIIYPAVKKAKIHVD